MTYIRQLLIGRNQQSKLHTYIYTYIYLQMEVGVRSYRLIDRQFKKKSKHDYVYSLDCNRVNETVDYNVRKLRIVCNEKQ